MTSDTIGEVSGWGPKAFGPVLRGESTIAHL